MPTDQTTFNAIQDTVLMTLGFKSDTTWEASSLLFSKTVYNQILQQIKHDFKDKSIDERGNKTYNPWRYFLGDLDSNVDVATTKPPETEPTMDHIGLINHELDKLLKRTDYNSGKWRTPP
ncbi:MAG: hypothetical protein GY786_21840 [Proteobacteria bacterium]|nr:hypothetical protein [Pseudomonadota bacterium]